VGRRNFQGLLRQKEMLHCKHLASQGAPMIRVSCQDFVVGGDRLSIVSPAAMDISFGHQQRRALLLVDGNRTECLQGFFLPAQVGIDHCQAEVAFQPGGRTGNREFIPADRLFEFPDVARRLCERFQNVHWRALGFQSIGQKQNFPVPFVPAQNNQKIMQGAGIAGVTLEEPSQYFDSGLVITRSSDLNRLLPESLRRRASGNVRRIRPDTIRQEQKNCRRH